MFWFDVFRIAHIIAGFLALFIFWIPVVVKKGGSIHRKIGWTYVGAMAMVAISAFYMGFYRIFFQNSGQDVISFSWFLIYIAILSSATAWYGIRVLRYKKRESRHSNGWDLGVPILLFVCSIIILWYGIQVEVALLTYFPIVGLFLGGSQLAYWLQKPKIKGHWLIEHLIGMLSCCIATVTAFVVFGAPRLLEVETVSILLWFAPAVVIVPVIVGFSVYYRRKMNPVQDDKKQKNAQ
ncbi:DUF2306 domain-containing protein [Gracilibacillus sp. YIM 98692]|uniref:DUF2306 domain-containing protein n=1 Tax=Gracilibacillus sp. YIM 98692 TaxID=2663532 RepID=UPI0013CF880D|nr:DUF2306 domain-containing protein [Gracilibacillus sp. YIM 98692]